MNKQNTKISMVATPLVIVCGLLLSGASAMAQSEAQWDNRHRSCSNRTLYGDYGFTVLGTIALPGGTVQDGAGLPVRGVVLTHYDGKGNLTTLDHIVINGMPAPVDWRPGSGTYTVNPDCTGTQVINIPSSPEPPLSLHFVVVKEGKEIHQVVDANAVTAIGIKLGLSPR